MDIGTLSSNVLAQHVSGVLTNKQVHNSGQNDDANVTATLEDSQNIGENSLRKVEQSTEADSSAGADNNGDLQSQNGEKGLLLDIDV